MAEDIGAQLAEMVNAEQAPAQAQEQTQVQAQAQEPAPEPQVEQAPAFDPSQFESQFASQSEQIQAIADQMGQLSNRIPEPQAPEPTEQEVIAQELKRQLGIDGLEGQLTEQQQIIAKQNEQLEQFQAMQQQAEAEKAFAQLETEFGQIDRTVLQNKILEIGQSNPALAEAMNSPEGARMLLAQGVGVTNASPDPVTPSSNSADIGSDQTLDRIRNGEGSKEDFGDALLQFVQ